MQLDELDVLPVFGAAEDERPRETEREPVGLVVTGSCPFGGVTVTDWRSGSRVWRSPTGRSGRECGELTALWRVRAAAAQGRAVLRSPVRA